jgi:N-acetylglucosamine-6-phosphate deacetylase
LKQAIINADIFDGETLLKHHAVMIDGERITAVAPQGQLASPVGAVHDMPGATLVPGFIDLQVNGGGGVLFNAAPTVEGIRAIGAAHRQFGTTGFLPTLISDSFQVMHEAIAAVRRALAEGVPGVLGIHLEGPFLNHQRKGAHDETRFCALDEEGFELVASLDNGVTLLTLAPELTSSQLIRRLSDAGVVVCAGHTAADYAQTREALGSGIQGFTHLYNAMTPLQSREPGVVGAALEDEGSWFGIIADGYHVHPASFRVAVAAKQPGGAILVTDAMPTVGSNSNSFELNNEIIVARNGQCVNAAGSLAGSDLDMLSAVNNACRFAGIQWFEAVRMASLYPARALGLDSQLGLIRTGYRASLLALDKQGQILASWIDGHTAPLRGSETGRPTH